MPYVPRIVIAAPASGSGKTTVATGLMAALCAQGLTVSGHKVGPDYIDPGYHALATGRPPRNLDPMLCGEERVAPLFRHGSQGADIAVIEGVMGLFDGAAQAHHPDQAGDFASTAHVATLLGAPVVLVVDAARASRSVAALVHGFRSYDPNVEVAGVILNRVGSDRHEDLLREAVADTGVPVLGAIRRDDGLTTPSRHLGLIPAAERGRAAREAVTALGEVLTRSCDLTAISRIANTAAPLSDAPWLPGEELASAGVTRPLPARIAIAGGPAFTFSYTEHAELLRAGGAEIATVDPLRDERLPEGTDALIIGGGFPELHAGELSANAPLRREIADLAGRRTPIAAECAGLLYLARGLDSAPMCGLVPAEATMTPQLTLGYRTAVAVSDSVLARAGTRVHGHEFHRTSLTPEHGAAPAWRWRTDGPEGFTGPGLHASYLHLHWAGTPGIAARLLGAAATARNGAPHEHHH